MHKPVPFLQLGVFFLGFSTFATQVACLRELFMLFQGNELTLGLVLSLWMGFVALGARMYRLRQDRFGQKGFLGLLLFLSVMPLVAMYLLPYLRYTMFPPALELGPLVLMALFGLTLGLFCYVSGWSFSWIVAYAEIAREHRYGGFYYGIEALGSLFGGLFVNVLLALFIPAGTLLLIMAIMGLAAFCWYAFRWKRKIALIFGVLLVVSILLGAFLLNRVNGKLPFLRNAQEIVVQDTPQGRFIRFTQNGQRYFYENNVPITRGMEPVLSEELVHFGMSQCADGKNALLLGKAFSPHVQELLKYDGLQVDFFCPDVFFRQQDSLFPVLKNLRVRTFWGDPVRLLRKNDSRYDVIFMDLPVPNTVRVNRYYTLSFFRQLASLLTQNGVVIMRLPVSGTRFEESAARMVQSIRRTFGKIFPEQLFVHNEGTYLLGSRHLLDYDLTKSIRAYKLPTHYIASDMPGCRELEQNSSWVWQSVEKAEVRVNRNLFPVAYFSAIHSWLAQIGANSLLYWLIPMIIMVVAFFVFTSSTFSMFAVGFTASSFEFLLLLAFQVFFGYLYLATGFIIMLFMGGLAYGAHWGHKRTCSVQKLMWILIFVLGCSALTVWALTFFAQEHLAWLALSGLLVWVSVLTGMLFSAIAHTGRVHGKSIGAIYGADMMGAALGAFLTAVYILPGIGFYYTLLGLGALNLLALGKWLVRKA